MSKGYSLHIGVNKLDKAHYFDVPELKAAVADAKFWKAFAEQNGYKSKKLHNDEATASAVLTALSDYAQQLQAGDILLLTYAGHGSQIGNDKVTGLDNERNDQTWCLYDRELLDDELFEAFRKFGEGTRILIVSDSCHSGTIARVAKSPQTLSEHLAAGLENATEMRGLRSRKLPLKQEQDIMETYGPTVYGPLQDKFRATAQAANVKAAVKLLAACQDDQTTFDGESNGVFTESFIELFRKAATRRKNAPELIDAIRERYYYPRPNFFEYGAIIPTFDAAFPFQIEIPDAAVVKGSRKPDLKPAPAGRNLTKEEEWDEVKVKRNAQLLVTWKVPPAKDIDPGKDIDILEKGADYLVLEMKTTPHEHSWSAAHALRQSLLAAGLEAVVEPIMSVSPAQDKRATREGDANNPDYIREWPPAMGEAAIGWHLGDAHSQLAKATAEVQAMPGAHVRIAHLDTGYIAGHPALPENLDLQRQRSFVSKENPNLAQDKPESGQDGHGLGTVVLLAGGKVTKAQTFGEYEGYIGGAPVATVVPCRISESVVIMNDRTFAEAIEYAIGEGCEVVSMSMAGKPSQRMARAVNRAYEAGIVVVSAASNCWYKGTGALLPKCVLFPAAFERVIAATGAMYDHKPYDVDFLREGSERAISTQYMQGSWGPASRMTRALAGYTPNTPWASSVHPFVRSGGGTSSATPQVAATAALYIARHRNEMEKKGYYDEGKKWMKVEAVRHALFTSAAKGNVFADWKKYYGNGIIRAWDALQVPVAEPSRLVQSPSAESSWWGIVEIVGSFFKRRKLFRSATPVPPEDALAAELLHLLQTDPQFYELFSRIDLSNPVEIEATIGQPGFRDKVQASPYASSWLKEAMMM
ncbi:S8 family serine peptidase [Chitinophaga rhizosphaerae]|uniref:S8 family serine peptidase n=1 Tax=Chitinophaga rhizosphaerae TaxID=1864947 RepID=UPI000F7FE530|nr:S8 family serine peptidase [Chitinophaga rhizosphaerae]